MSKNKAIFFILLAVSAASGQRIIKPQSSSELQSAFDQASPDDIIQMLPMIYSGNFVIQTNGGTLTGDYNSTIESDGIGIRLPGSNWKLKSFWIKGPTKGIVIEGRDNVVEGVVLQKTGQAVVVTGEGNKVKGCVISEADLGIILDGSRNTLHSNAINIQTPAIIIPKHSCCNVLDGNVANGEVNIEGTGNKLTGNVCNHGLYVIGCDNEFKNNVANGASFPKECQSHDQGGNVYRGLGPGDTDLPVPNQPKNPVYYPPPLDYNGGQGQPTPVQVSGNGPAPKCSCSCAY